MFAHKFDKKQEINDIKEHIPPEFHKYLSIFDEEASFRLPEWKPWDHKIDLKPGFEPKSAKVYPLTPKQEEATEKFIKENLDLKRIRKSDSPQASGFFFVPKKDDKLRPCQDYRYLNEWTIKNAYPLPLVTDLMDKLKGAKYFTKLDVRWGYNNIRIREGDEWKAAFKTKFGLYEPTVMFFRLCNSPATFQSMMNSIFKDQITRNFVIIYMDDILIFAKTKEELEQYTKEVLQVLKDNDLYLKPEKCEFYKEQINYLGFVISHDKIAMDPSKVAGLKEWPAPETVKQVRSFLGFGNFYRKFIRKYSDLARPLNELLQKGKEFRWTTIHQEAFEELKKRFSEEPVLMMPDMDKPFQIKSDASKYAYGAVLTQMDTNGN
jgi:hypothetical protein